MGLHARDKNPLLCLACGTETETQVVLYSLFVLKHAEEKARARGKPLCSKFKTISRKKNVTFFQ